MSRTVAILAVLGAGAVVAVQAPANAALSEHVGDLGAAFVSTAISMAIMLVLVLAFGQPGRLASLVDFRAAWALGGIGGAVVVAVGLVAVRSLGAAAVIALLVAGQLAVSLVADRFGWLGLHHIGIGAGRIAGVVLVLAGTVLVTRS